MTKLLLLLVALIPTCHLDTVPLPEVTCSDYGCPGPVDLGTPDL